MPNLFFCFNFNYNANFETRCVSNLNVELILKQNECSTLLYHGNTKTTSNIRKSKFLYLKSKKRNRL